MDIQQPAKTVKTPGWNSERRTYICADGMRIMFRNMDTNGVRWMRKRIGNQKYLIFVSGIVKTRDETIIFNGTNDARTVVLPLATRKLENSAFENRKSLRSIIMNEGLEDVGRASLSGTSLRELALPSTLRVLRCDAIKECQKIQAIRVADNCELDLRNYVPLSTQILPFKSAKVGELSLFDYRNMKDVQLPEGLKRLGNYQFCGSAVETVLVPASVREIGSYCFAECGNLKSIHFVEGSKLEKVDKYCFYMTPLETVEFPPSLREFSSTVLIGLDDTTFYVPDNCDTDHVQPHSIILPQRDICLNKAPLWQLRLTRVVKLPSELKKIGNWWFYGAYLAEVTIPKRVRVIGARAFQRCNQLQTVIFQKGSQLEKIEGNCFRESALSEFTFPENVREVGADAFRSCKKLKRVTLNEGLERICESCFAVSGVKEIVIPASLREMGHMAFCNCQQLQQVTLNEELKVLGRSVFAHTALHEIHLPRSLKKLEYGVFSDCKNLRVVDLPEGLEEVGEWCFWGAGIHEILIPRSVKVIREKAFYGCCNLRLLTFAENSELKDVQKNAFCDTQLTEEMVDFPSEANILSCVFASP